MEENKIYRLSEITVNADELRRILDELDDMAANYITLHRRLQNLINQGTITKHAKTNTAGESLIGIIAKKDTENAGRETKAS